MGAIRDPDPTLDAKAWYRIEVRGLVPVEWAARLGDLRFRHCVTEGDATNTVLTGEVADQAALMGVLSTLHMLHLPLKSVVCLGTHCPLPEGNDPCSGEVPVSDESQTDVRTEASCIT